jgi:hypothetical protein
LVPYRADDPLTDGAFSRCWPTEFSHVREVWIDEHLPKK